MSFRGLRISGISIHGTYDTARGIAGLAAFIGWALAAVGVLVVIIGLNVGSPFNILVAAVGIGILALGVLQVAGGQILRAAVDSADYSRQLLLIQIALAEGKTEIDLRRPTRLDKHDGSAGAPLAVEDAANGDDLTATSVRSALELRGYAIKRFAFNNKYQVHLPDGQVTVLDGDDDFLIWGRDELWQKFRVSKSTEIFGRT